MGTFHQSVSKHKRGAEPLGWKVCDPEHVGGSLCRLTVENRRVNQPVYNASITDTKNMLQIILKSTSGSK